MYNNSFPLTNVIGGGRSLGTLRLVGRLLSPPTAPSATLSPAFPFVAAQRSPSSPPFSLSNATEDKRRLRNAPLATGSALQGCCRVAVAARSKAAGCWVAETREKARAARDTDIIVDTDDKGLGSSYGVNSGSQLDLKLVLLSAQGIASAFQYSPVKDTANVKLDYD